MKNTDYSSTSITLLQRARALEPEAWRRLTSLYTPLVYRWCRQAGLQPADVADVAQEVFRSVAKGIATYFRLPEESRMRFRSWLWGVTRNKIADHFRRSARSPAAVGGDSANDHLAQLPDEPEQWDEGAFRPDVALLHRALEMLECEFEPRTWAAFMRTAVGNERAADIAEELGMSKQAVRQAKYRVLRRLRIELDGHFN